MEKLWRVLRPKDSISATALTTLNLNGVCEWDINASGHEDWPIFVLGPYVCEWAPHIKNDCVTSYHHVEVGKYRQDVMVIITTMIRSEQINIWQYQKYQ